MEKSKLNGLFLILILLLVPYEEELGEKMMHQMVAEARTCESKSQGFKGPCVSNQNCALVCKNEGFPGGKCRGLRRRCCCTKPCLLDQI
ncbi:defensin-like protein 1 [Rutidosis leptorrhynchoides]|uniref:defensin-like protein 1 n=1 Tax=Rutidosis leptorrhynchoides TaxID=125765 RepID=UPI003A99AC98